MTVTQRHDKWMDWYPRYQRVLRSYRKARQSTGPIRPIDIPVFLQTQFLDYHHLHYEVALFEHGQAIVNLSFNNTYDAPRLGMELSTLLSSVTHQYQNAKVEAQLVDLCEGIRDQLHAQMIEAHRRMLSRGLPTLLERVFTASFHAFHALCSTHSFLDIEKTLEVLSSSGPTFTLMNEDEREESVDILQLVEKAIYSTRSSVDQGKWKGMLRFLKPHILPEEQNNLQKCLHDLIETLIASIHIAIHLQVLGLGRDVHVTVKRVIFTEIQAHTDQMARTPSSLHQSVILPMESWCNHFFGHWKQLILQKEHGGNDRKSLERAPECAEIKGFLREIVGHTRAINITEIIRAYPDSRPALEDIKECAGYPRVVEDLREHYVHDTKQFLFNAGTCTSMILHWYIVTIRIMRYLDSSGILLEMASKPLREYLKLRPDTIRCIVTSLLDTKRYPELHEELRRGEVLRDDMIDLHHAPWNSEDWTPDPIEADPKLAVLRLKTTDTVTALISLFPEMTKYTSEIQDIMAQRLLQLKRYKTKTERENLDLLQFRFGKAPLETCWVMMKDISWSSWYHLQMKEAQKKELADAAPSSSSSSPLHSSIYPRVLSRMFWPEMEEEEWHLPKPVLRTMLAFEEAYKKEAPGRYIDWQPHLGQAIIEVSLGSRKRGRDGEYEGPQVVEMVVSPMQATVLLAFNKKGSRTVDQLVDSTRIDEEVLLSTLRFWVARGLLRHLGTRTYIPVDAEEGLGGHGSKPPYTLNLLEGMLSGMEEDEKGEEEEDEEGKRVRDEAILGEGALRSLGSLEPDLLRLIEQSPFLILKTLHAYIVTNIVRIDPSLHNLSEEKVEAYLSILIRNKKIKRGPQGAYLPVIRD